MITTLGKVMQMKCVEDIGKKDRNCMGLICPAIRFFDPPPGGELKMKPTPHGIPDKDKRVYCGKCESH